MAGEEYGGAHWLALFIRVVLAAGFLSAVGDRLGLWGSPGASGVAWGDFASYQAYTGHLTPWAPPSLVPVLAWVATVAEVVLAMWLLSGWRIRLGGLLSGLLLLSFAFGMVLHAGIKAPLDYSVLAAAGAAFSLSLLGAGALAPGKEPRTGN